MPWDDRNLAYTVGPRYRSVQPCAVPREKITPLYRRVAADEPDEAERKRILFDSAHSWSDHAGGLKGGTCTRCGKTLSEARKPEPPPGSSAHLERALSTGE